MYFTCLCNVALLDFFARQQRTVFAQDFVLYIEPSGISISELSNFSEGTLRILMCISMGFGGIGKMLACVSSCAHMCISRGVREVGKIFAFVSSSAHMCISRDGCRSRSLHEAQKGKSMACCGAMCASGGFGNPVKMRMSIHKSSLHSGQKLSLFEAGERQSAHCLADFEATTFCICGSGGIYMSTQL